MADKVPTLILLFSIGICVHTGFANAKEYYDILPQAYICKILNADIVYNFTCTTKNVNPTTVLRTRDIHFQPGVELDNGYVSVQLFRKFGSTFRPFLFKIEQDMCMFAMGTYSREAVMLKRVLNISTQKINGNFYDPCPLTGRRYEIDVRSDFSKLPDVVQPGKYRIDATTYTFIDGVRTNFLLVESYCEVRSKLSKTAKKSYY